MSQLFIEYQPKNYKNLIRIYTNLGMLKGWCEGKSIRVPKDIWNLIESKVNLKYNFKAISNFENFNGNVVLSLKKWLSNVDQQNHNPLYTIQSDSARSSDFNTLTAVICEDSIRESLATRKLYGSITTVDENTIYDASECGELLIGVKPYDPTITDWFIEIKISDVWYKFHKNVHFESFSSVVCTPKIPITEIIERSPSGRLLDFTDKNFWTTKVENNWKYEVSIFPISLRHITSPDGCQFKFSTKMTLLCGFLSVEIRDFNHELTTFPVSNNYYYENSQLKFTKDIRETSFYQNDDQIEDIAEENPELFKEYTERIPESINKYLRNDIISMTKYGWLPLPPHTSHQI
jgi:hypothetical protein